jgi:hypothetical protein
MLYLILLLSATNIFLFAFLAFVRRDSKKHLLSALQNNRIKIKHYFDELSEIADYMHFRNTDMPDRNITYDLHLSQVAYQLSNYERLMKELTNITMNAASRIKYQTLLHHQEKTIDNLQRDIYELSEYEMKSASSDRIYA